MKNGNGKFWILLSVIVALLMAIGGAVYANNGNITRNATNIENIHESLDWIKATLRAAPWLKE